MGTFIGLFHDGNKSIKEEDVKKFEEDVKKFDKLRKRKKIVDEVYDWIWDTKDRVCVKYLTIYFTNILNILRNMGWEWDDMFINNKEFIEYNLRYRKNDVIINCHNVFNDDTGIDLRIWILPSGYMTISFIQGNKRIMEICHEYMSLSHFIYPPNEGDAKFDKFIATYGLFMNVDVVIGGSMKSPISTSGIAYYDPDGEWKYVEKRGDNNA